MDSKAYIVSNTLKILSNFPNCIFWWMFKQIPTGLYIYIYIYIDIHMFCVYLCVYVYVLFIYFISFISLSMSETNIRPCIALWQIALYQNLALLFVSLHPVLTIIHLEIEIRTHKPRLPALIVMKDCYQFVSWHIKHCTCLQLVKIV